MHSKHKNEGKVSKDGESNGSGKIVDEKVRIFKGLAMLDREISDDGGDEDGDLGAGLAELTAFGEKSREMEKEKKISDAIEDMLPMLESLEGKAKRVEGGRKIDSRKRSRSSDYGDYESRSHRHRSRPRSRGRDLCTTCTYPLAFFD